MNPVELASEVAIPDHSQTPLKNDATEEVILLRREDGALKTMAEIEQEVIMKP